jgi:septal ring factor EnvC (AmiA/AmiB activator)
LILTAGSASAQSEVVQDYRQQRQKIVEQQQNTRAEIQQLNKQITKYEERLKLADQKYEALFKKYKDLKNLIALQDQKLSKMQREQSQVTEEITVTNQSLEQKRQELKQLIENYKQTLDYLYKHGRTSQLALIFSSASINQMLVRAFYLEKFNNFRERQAQEIREKESELEQTREQLQQAQSKNKEILADIKQEKQKLAEKKEQQQQNVALLRENRDQIKKSIEQAKEQVNNLESRLASYDQRKEEIDEDIKEAKEREIRRRELQRQQNLEEAKKIKDDVKRAREVAKYSEPINKNELDSEKLAASFSESKGSLPWPVESRTISEHFGRKRHPVYGTYTQGHGIEIVTEAQATVQAVHQGVVIDIRPVPGYGDMVVIKHGHFLTAYGNLSQIMVRKNQVLSQGDQIGLSGTPDSPKGESLFFLIRKNSENVDPEKWLQMEAISGKY